MFILIYMLTSDDRLQFLSALVYSPSQSSNYAGKGREELTHDEVPFPVVVQVVLSWRAL
jgi:hypothetical protein